MIKLKENYSYKIIFSYSWIMFTAGEVEDGIKCIPINLIEYSYEESLNQNQLTLNIDKPEDRGMTIDITDKDIISIDQLENSELKEYHFLVNYIYTFILNNK